MAEGNEEKTGGGEEEKANAQGGRGEEETKKESSDQNSGKKGDTAGIEKKTGDGTEEKPPVRGGPGEGETKKETSTEKIGKKGAKKSAAKIRRMQKRAAERGEEYTPPAPIEQEIPDLLDGGAGAAVDELKAALAIDVSAMNAKERRHHKRKLATLSEAAGVENVEDLLPAGNSQSTQEEKSPLYCAALKLKNQLEAIGKDTSMNAKERRSAKKKAEALAKEDSKCELSVLREFILTDLDNAKTGSCADANRNQDEKTPAPPPKPNPDPYIVFVGQISFTTTAEQLFQHFKKELGSAITPESMQVRLLTDSKTNKSRGMAFLQLNDPELMYECLTLHRTHLDERRINVERSAGGRKNSTKRQAKIQTYRTTQEKMLSDTMDKILQEYRDRGDLEGELDEGVVLLCKRHSAHVVDQAISEYVEAGGKTKNNPSAFLTAIIGRIAVEGADKKGADKKDDRPKKRMKS